LNAESPFKLESPYSYKKISVSQVLDAKIFKVCEIKEKEIGIIRKKFQYVHFDGKQWRILQISADLAEFKYFKIE